MLRLQSGHDRYLRSIAAIDGSRGIAQFPPRLDKLANESVDRTIVYRCDRSLSPLFLLGSHVLLIWTFVRRGDCSLRAGADDRLLAAAVYRLRRFFLLFLQSEYLMPVDLKDYSRVKWFQTSGWLPVMCHKGLATRHVGSRMKLLRFRAILPFQHACRNRFTNRTKKITKN